MVTKFCRSGSRQFSSYIDYLDRDEAARAENAYLYNLYQDYMGDPEKMGSLFTEYKDVRNPEEKQKLKEIYQTAQDNGSLMWQTVISFDNRWLEKNGLYQKEGKILDEERLKNITRSAVHRMLEKEGLEHAVWSAAVHYNTDNIHIHIATVEPDPMREKMPIRILEFDSKWLEKNGVVNEKLKQSYYMNVKEDELFKASGSGKYISRKVAGEIRMNLIRAVKRETGKTYQFGDYIQLTKEGNIQVTYLDTSGEEPPMSRMIQDEMEYRGKFKQSSIETCKREMVNQIVNDRENIKKINDIIRGSIVAQKKEHPLAKDRELAGMFWKLYQDIPKVNRNLWNYNNNILSSLRSEIDAISEAYLTKYHKDDLEELKERLEIQKIKYEEAYGSSRRDYAEGQWQDLKSRLGNAILKELREFAKEQEAVEKLSPEEDIPNLPDGIENYLSSFSDDREVKNMGVDDRREESREQDVVYPEEEAALYTVDWSDNYKKAKWLLHKRLPEYQKAIELLEKELQAGNILAAYELGDVYRYGRGTPIDMDHAESYYQIAFKGFYQAYYEGLPNQKVSEKYLAYRLGKMYYYGLGTETDYEDAWMHFEDSGNQYAIYMMGKMAYHGQGVKQDYEEAYGYFYRISDENPYAAYQAAAMIDSQKIQDSKEKMDDLYNKAFLNFTRMEEKQADDNLEYRIGSMYLNGLGTDKNEDLAEEYLDASAESGNIYAKNKLAMLYLKQGRMDKLPKIVENLTEAAEKTGNTWSMYALGNIYSSNEYGQRDDKKAEEWYLQAEGEGDEFVSYKLGKLYMDKESVLYNPELAVNHLEKAVEKGSMFAGYQMGNLFMDQSAGMYDPEKAVFYWEQAAQKGNTAAAYQMGKTYMNKENERYDTAKAVTYFEQAAKEDSKYAGYQLGKLYGEEQYGIQDEDKAYFWFSKAEEEGNEYASYQLGKIDYSRRNYSEAIRHFKMGEDPYSHYYLGKIYLDKSGTVFQPKKGIAYMKQSAAEGNSFAELGMGLLYLKGDVVDRNIPEAERWLGQAAEHGNQIADEICQKIRDGDYYRPRQHIARGMAMEAAIRRMKCALKSEWEKNLLEREHEQMTEYALNPKREDELY